MRVIFLIIAILALVAHIGYSLIVKKKYPSWLLVYILGALIAVNGYSEMKWQTAERKAHDMTLEVMEHYGPMEGFSTNNVPDVHCQRITEAWFDAQRQKWGEAWIADQKIVLSYDTCSNFIEVLEDANWKNDKTDKHIAAIGTIIHEGVHLTGESNEASTECKSQKYLPIAYDNLNVPEEYKPVLLARASEIASRMPKEYLGGVC